MMAEMIATYPSQGKSSEAVMVWVPEAASGAPAAGDGGYLNEVRSVSTMPSGRDGVGDAQA